MSSPTSYRGSERQRRWSGVQYNFVVAVCVSPFFSDNPLMDTFNDKKEYATTVEVQYDADGYEIDKHQAEAGHGVVHLKRRFSLFACLGVAFAILNSWTAMASSLQVVLPSGGSISMVWGLLASAIGAFLMVLSL